MLVSKNTRSPGTQSTLIPMLGKAKECKTSFLKKKKLLTPTSKGRAKFGSKLCQMSRHLLHKEETKHGIPDTLYSQNHCDAST